MDFNDSGGASVGVRDRTPLNNTLGVNDMMSQGSSLHRTSKCIILR